MRYWFTADLHLRHPKILMLAGRDYPDIATHDEWLQININQKVEAKDHLCIVGDVAFGSVAALSDWFDGIKCKNISVVYGNHDDTVKTLIKRQPKRFRRHGERLEFKLPAGHAENAQDVHIVCDHYAGRVWNKSHNGSYQLYGHSHGTLADDPKMRAMDVGVDTNNMFPWSLQAILAKLSVRAVRAVDKHEGFHHIPGITICGLCGNKKMDHQATSFCCPMGSKTRVGFTCYHPSQYFAPPKNYERISE